MPATIDYFYTLISPFTYLGGPRLAEVAARTGATVVHKPVKMGEVFAASGGLPLGQRPPQRRAYRLMELRRISRRAGLPLTLEPRFFPVDDTLAAHAVIAAQRAGHGVDALAQAFLRAVWAEERDISDAATVRAIVAAEGLDADVVLDAAGTAEVAAIRDANTREAIDRGVFGAPTYALGDELFWGQDRLDYLEEALAG